MNLDRLEELLETMSPEDIRAQYGEALAKDPRCEAMLTAFEGMDDHLKQLKDAVPAPEFRPPKKAWLPATVTWALPQAAVLVLGIMLGSGLLQKNAASREAAALMERGVPKRVTLPNEVFEGVAEEDTVVDEVTQKDLLRRQDLPTTESDMAPADLEKQQDQAEELVLEVPEARPEPKGEAPKVQKMADPQNMNPARNAASSQLVEPELAEELVLEVPEAKPEPKREVPRAQKKADPQGGDTVGKPVEPEPVHELVVAGSATPSEPQKPKTITEDAQVGALERAAEDRPAPPSIPPPFSTQEESPVVLDRDVAMDAADRARKPAKPSSALSQFSDLKEADSNGRRQEVSPRISQWLERFRARLEGNLPLNALFEADPTLAWQKGQDNGPWTLRSFEEAWQLSPVDYRWEAVRIVGAGDRSVWQVFLPVAEGAGDGGRVLSVTLSAAGRCSALRVTEIQ